MKRKFRIYKREYTFVMGYYDREYYNKLLCKVSRVIKNTNHMAGICDFWAVIVGLWMEGKLDKIIPLLLKINDSKHEHYRHTVTCRDKPSYLKFKASLNQHIKHNGKPVNTWDLMKVTSAMFLADKLKIDSRIKVQNPWI